MRQCVLGHLRRGQPQPAVPPGGRKHREAIIAGDLGSGDALPIERELSESFGISHASVREALRAPQAQGLVSAGGAPVRATVAEGAGGHAPDALITLLRLNGVGSAT